MTAGAFTWLGDVFAWLGDRGDQLTDWAGNWWFLGVIVGLTILDSIIPVVPSESVLIIAGIAVATGGAPYPLYLVILAGVVGAILGDNLAYVIGRRFSQRIRRRAERSEKFAERLHNATTQIRRRGGALLITARFIPGGRTALTVSSGITHQPRSWFVRWVIIAAAIWASYAAGLAYVIGKPLEDNQSAAFWAALGVAVGINILIEVIRHRRGGKLAEPGTADLS